MIFSDFRSIPWGNMEEFVRMLSASCECAMEPQLLRAGSRMKIHLLLMLHDVEATLARRLSDSFTRWDCANRTWLWSSFGKLPLHRIQAWTQRECLFVPEWAERTYKYKNAHVYHLGIVSLSVIYNELYWFVQYNISKQSPYFFSQWQSPGLPSSLCRAFSPVSTSCSAPATRCCRASSSRRWWRCWRCRAAHCGAWPRSLGSRGGSWMVVMKMSRVRNGFYLS